MAALPNVNPSAAARWSLAALVHGLHALHRLRGVRWEPTLIAAPTTQSAATVTSDTIRVPRHYPAKRDRVIESAAMAREMYRL